MKKLFFLLVFAIINFQLWSQEYIVKFKPNFSENKLKESLQINLLKPIFENHLDNKKERIQNFDDLKLFYTTDNISKVRDEFKEFIDYIEPNFLYKIENNDNFNDKFIDEQWNLIKIKAYEAWQTATGDGILVGVIDTGIDYYHPDLINQIYVNNQEDLNGNGQLDPWSNEVEIDGIKGDFNGIDDDGNGFIDDVTGFDFVDQYQLNIGDSQTNDSDPADENGHGTAVAGVIAAQPNNGIGIVGVAYNSKILPVRAFDATGNAESDDIAKAIIYATLQGAKVLNFSFGEIFPSKLVHEAIKFAYKNNVVMVASSGNNNWDLNHYPSDFEEVISVTAVNKDNKRSSNGNYGNRLNLAAPGTNIFTTLIDSSYGYKSGTSFAAPHVSAAASIILEKYPDLSPSEVLGILEASATDLGARGWDYQYASGLVNCYEALNQIAPTTISIKYPENNAFIDRTMNKLPIIGNIITPLFENFEVFLGKGLNPKDWKLITINEKQVLQDTITNINLDNLQDTLYTVKIVINLKNLSTLEKRFYINLYSDNTPLKILNINPVKAYYKNSKIIIFNAITNYPCNFRVKYRRANSTDEFQEITEMNKFKVYHQIPLEATLDDGNYEAKAIAELDNGIRTEVNFTFTYERNFIPENNSIYPKEYGLPLSYLLNDVADFYGNGKDCIVINDLSSGDWGNIKIYEFDSTNFYLKDHLNYKWIPKGIGDSNGDGIPEIFATSFKQSVLFQAKNIGESPFSSILFSDTLSLNFWAETLYDLDNDSKDEVIAYSDTAFIAFKYNNGNYEFTSKADPDYYIGTYPGFTANDFDSDGNAEILFGNRQGNFFVYEFSNNQFHKEYENISSFSSSEQYITSGSFIDSASYEIIIGDFGSTPLYGREETGESIWAFRVLKYIDNSYKIIDTIFIYGVRGGLEYKNGISSGDLDNDGLDELVISTFPNLYIFKWNEDSNSFKPIWIYPYTFSNTAIIHDFDKNGINEIGFTTFSGLRFFEFDLLSPKPEVPLNLIGWADNQNTAILKWDTVKNAEYYEVLRLVKNNEGYVGYLVGTTNANSFTIDTLKPNSKYDFVVRSANNNLHDKFSDISNVVSIYTYPKTKINFVKVQSENQIIISFTNKIKANSNPNNFKLVNLDFNLNYVPNYSQYFNDSTILLSFNKKLEHGNYKLLVNSFFDYFNNPTLPDSIEFIIEKKNEVKELYLTNLIVKNKSEIQLFFSEEIDETTATDKNNYQLLPYGNIENISLNEDKISVNILLDSQPPLLANGKTYTITCKNVLSSSGEKMTNGPGNSLSFVFFAQNLSDVYTYPSPFSLNNHTALYFANLPPEAEIKIFDINQTEINTLYEYDGNGGYQWNLEDKNGNKITPGLYLFKIVKINDNGEKTESQLNKFIILP